MGTIISIEGTWEYGETRHADGLFRYLSENHRDMQIGNISFPRRHKRSSLFAQDYLSGQFGKDLDSINPYLVEQFFALDRALSAMPDKDQLSWKEVYDNGGTIIMNHYTDSIFITDMAKIPEEEWEYFIDWVLDFENNRLRLPEPDVVIYLDMPVEAQVIHSLNPEMDQRRRKAGLYAAEQLDYKIISCMEGKDIKPAEQIHAEVCSIAEEVLR